MGNGRPGVTQTSLDNYSFEDLYIDNNYTNTVDKNTLIFTSLIKIISFITCKNWKVLWFGDNWTVIVTLKNLIYDHDSSILMRDLIFQSKECDIIDQKFNLQVKYLHGIIFIF